MLERALQPEPGCAPAKPDGAPLVRPLNILLADDSPVNQEVAKGLLEMRSHHVACVSNGCEAVSAAAANRYDVILMDVEMPEMDGLQAAKQVRKLPEYFDEPPYIVAMTARSKSELETGDPSLFENKRNPFPPTSRPPE